MIKNILKQIFVTFGGNIILREVNRTPRILYYHSIDNISAPEIETMAISINIFKKQIFYLLKHYEIVSIEELYKRYENNSFTNNEIVLTFDDGYANNLYFAAPFLKEHNIPFSVFISTEHIDSGEYYPTSIARIIILGSSLKKIKVPFLHIENLDISKKELKLRAYDLICKEIKSRPLKDVRTIIGELKNNISCSELLSLLEKYKSDRPMTWTEVKEIQNMGATIGSHCKFHMICHSNQELEDLEEQIIDSKRVIEKRLNTKCLYFVYPNGNYTSISNKIVESAGYKMGFSTEIGLIKKERLNKFSLPRIKVAKDIVSFKQQIAFHPIKNLKRYGLRSNMG